MDLAWIMACHEVVVKMSLGLQSSEGLTEAGESFTYMASNLVLTVGRRPQFLSDLSTGLASS